MPKGLVAGRRTSHGAGDSLPEAIVVAFRFFRRFAGPENG